MTTFKTLMQREWMQHHRGWLIFCAVPLCFMLIGIAVGNVEVSSDDTALAVFTMMTGAYVASVMMMGWIGAAFQSAGLGRRDWQDRSIEFWRSLPVADWQATAATALMHLLVFQLLVAGVAVVCGVALGLLITLRVYGSGALASLPWPHLLAALAVLLPRVLVGVLAAALWIAPMLLALMAASAWLKRWGAMVLAAALGVGSTVLAQVYHLPWLQNTLVTQFLGFRDALLAVTRRDFASEEWSGVMADLAGWLWRDTLRVIHDIGQPAMAWGLLLGAISFALIVFRRQRG